MLFAIDVIEEVNVDSASVSLAGFRYRVGIVFAGECVELVGHGGLVETLHAGVLVATHAERRRAGEPASSPRRSPGYAKPPSG